MAEPKSLWDQSAMSDSMEKYDLFRRSLDEKLRNVELIDDLFSKKSSDSSSNDSNCTHHEDLVTPSNQETKTSDDKKEENINLINEEDYLQSDPVDITPNNDGGVTKQLLREGIGDESPGYGFMVSVRYKGYMIVSGSVQPLVCKEGITQIVLGKGTVVPGLEIAISSMKKNEISLFVVQPTYGYGEMGIPKVIPPYSILCFEVELVDWKYEDLSPKRDEGILRKVIERGEGTRFPNEGSSVKIKITGCWEGNIFEDREVDFILGEGILADISEGVECAIFKFRLHEISILYLKPKYAFGPERYEKYGIPLNMPLEYKVELLSFERAKDIWEMNSDEKYEKSKEARTKGVNFFKGGHYKVALRQFKKIIACLEKEPGVSPESEESRRLLLMAGYSNCAQCYKKLGHYVEAIKSFDKVLALDQDNEKALYQSGQCRMLVNDCDDALRDFQKLLVIKPDSILYKKSIEICKEGIKKQNLKDKEVYSHMFKKLASKTEK